LLLDEQSEGRELPQLEVTAVDIAILLGYVVLSRLLFGWYFARKTRGQGAESYFLAGRGLRWPIIGLSFYVSNMSGGSFIGLPGSAYSHGVAVYHYEWLPALILILFIFVFLPLFLEARVFTSAQFLRERYGGRIQTVFSVFMAVESIIVDATVSLYAGGRIIETLFPDFPVWITIGGAAMVAGIYISFGGLGAVVINDALQATLVMIGGIITLWVAWQAIPSWEAAVEASPERALHLIQPADDPLLPWPGLITGLLVLVVYDWCVNQFYIQRALGAKSLDDGRWGALFAGFLKLPNLFILVLPGIMARAIYPDLEDPDLVFPTLVFDLLPIGLRGLMLAVMAAAILSSLEAILNSASTLFTMDFVRTIRPQTSDDALERMGRIATIGFMLLAAVWAPVIISFPTLWQYLQSILSYLVPPVAAIFLFGIFWRRANENGALLALLVAVPLGAIGWVVVEIRQWVSIQFLYAAGIQFVFGSLLVVVGSLLSAPPPRDKVEKHTFRRELLARDKEHFKELRWYQDSRILSAALAALSLTMLVWWW
jgi:solute:Na+ symporter, SSS family